MAATERRDEGFWIITTLQGECSELQSGEPALCTCLQERTFFQRKWKPHHLYEECGRFLLREPEIGGTQFQQVALSTQLRKWERWIYAGRQDKMHAGRQMLQEKGERLMNGLVRNDLVIVQDENEVFLNGGSP